MTFTDVVDLARAGDWPTMRILAEAADRIGLAAATVSNTTSPEAIVLGGATAAFGEPWREAIREAFDHHSLPGRQGRRPQTQVVLGTLGRQASALGAVVLLVSRLGIEPIAR